MTDQKSVSDTTQENGVPSETKAESKADKVSYETYSKVLSEAKKLKEKVKSFEESLQKEQEEKLKSQNEWKTLAEQYKSKYDEETKAKSELLDQVTNGIKYDAFRRNLGGELVDEREFLEKVPFDKIVINPETKQIDEDSAKMAAAEFAKKYPYLVSFKSGKMPNVAANVSLISRGKSLETMNTKELEEHIINLSKAGRL
jgi:hypothetical protein